MKRRLIFATGNEGKMREIREILKDLDVEILSLKEAGIRLDAEENGTTFEENALIKARAAAMSTDAIVLADDSGLEIDYLGGEPGVYSARYLGENTSYRIKNQNLIDRLEGVPAEKRTARFVCVIAAGVPAEKRTARFVCVIAAVLPDGRTFTSRGTIEGIIGTEERGEGGFGYDPIFYLPEYGCSTAELTMEQKNEISHRGRALQAMKETLQKELPLLEGEQA